MTNSRTSLEKGLQQFIGSYGYNRVRDKTTNESNTTFVLIWVQQMQKRVKSNLRHHKGKTNSEVNLEKSVIQLVAS